MGVDREWKPRLSVAELRGVNVYRMNYFFPRFVSRRTPLSAIDFNNFLDITSVINVLLHYIVLNPSEVIRFFLPLSWVFQILCQLHNLVVVVCQVLQHANHFGNFLVFVWPIPRG